MLIWDYTDSADQITTRLNRLSASLEEDSLSPKERFLALRDASDTIKQFKLNQEEKIKIGTATCETMLAHTGYMDQVLLHFLLHDPSLFPPAPLFPPSGTNLQRLFARAMLSLSPNAINGRRRALQPPRPAIYNGESRKRPLSTSMNQQGSTKAQARRVPTISGAGPRTAINQRRWVTHTPRIIADTSIETNQQSPTHQIHQKYTLTRQQPLDRSKNHHSRDVLIVVNHSILHRRHHTSTPRYLSQSTSKTTYSSPFNSSSTILLEWQSRRMQMNWLKNPRTKIWTMDRLVVKMTGMKPGTATVMAYRMAK